MTESVLNDVLRLAALTLPAAGVQCLLIGGFAVNHYGYTRNTLDVDFMIAADQTSILRRIMVAAGFTNVALHDNVVFFGRPGCPLRVDFLRVDADTISRLDAKAVTATFHGHALRLPCLDDLLAMKLFALAQAPSRRLDKDLPDVAYLCVLNNLDLDRVIRPLCQRYASDDIYRLIQEKVESLHP